MLKYEYERMEIFSIILLETLKNLVKEHYNQQLLQLSEDEDFDKDEYVKKVMRDLIDNTFDKYIKK